MRNVSSFRRAASLLLGCWLAVFAAEPAALHACPVHDLAPQTSHASHKAHQPVQHHACTCPGACCPGVGVRLATPPAIAPARIVAFVEPDVAPATIVRSADVQLALPPAIGPPAHSG